MAKVREMNEPSWSEWVESRPEPVKSLCKKFPPDKLYLMTDTGQIVTLHSYSEDGTVTVDVSQQWNDMSIGRQVFGIDPANLKECDIPVIETRIFPLIYEDERE